MKYNRFSGALLQFAITASLVSPVLAASEPFIGMGLKEAPQVNAQESIPRLLIKPGHSIAIGKGGSQAIAQYLNQWSAITGTPLSLVRVMSDGVWLVSFQAPMQRSQVTSMKTALRNANVDIVSIDADVLFKTSAVPNDPEYYRQWHYFAPAGNFKAGSNLPQAWDITRGAGVTVAVLDTGYLPHGDLDGNMLAASGYDFMTYGDRDDQPGRDSNALDAYGNDWSPIDPPCVGRDCPHPLQGMPWHGTHVAGTIAAVGNNNLGVTGVAPEAKILPVRVIGTAGGTMSDIIDAIWWTAGYPVDQIPGQSQARAQIMNMSLGTTMPTECPAAMQAAINAAVNRGVSIVVAAGNSAWDASQYAPANCANVLTVSALSKFGSLASYSNTVDSGGIAAPGGDGALENGLILSTHNTGVTYPALDSYSHANGTSMAAPHVAGVAALVKSLRPDFSPAAIYQHLRSTSRPHLSNVCHTGICGAGILDAGRAVAGLYQTSLLPLRPGFAGSWYNPAHPGQGFVFDVSASQEYFYGGWFTFSPSGQAGASGQRWYTVHSATPMGVNQVNLRVYQNTGGRFDSAPITFGVDVGSATITFQSCTTATFTYNIVADGQQRSNTIPLHRLVPDAGCDNAGTPSTPLAAGINETLDGDWYDPATSGQGIQIDISSTAGNLVFASWFTYDVNGQPNSGPSGQRWYTVQGNYASGSLSTQDMPIYESINGRFDHPQTATFNQVGSASITFVSCSRADLTYRFDNGPSRTINLHKLVGAAGCTD